MFLILIFFQISLCYKEIKTYLIANAYERHDRIFDSTNHIFLKKAIFSNLHDKNINGGAIYINKYKYNCTLSNCTFNNCIGKNGGAIYLKTANHARSQSCSIYNAIFTNCNAINGGALYLKIGENERNSISIEGCTFKINSAQQNGGAIYAQSREKLAIQRNRFEDNSAAFKGASLWATIGNNRISSHQKLILYRNSFIFTSTAHNMVNVYIESMNIQKTNANVYLGLCSFESKNKNMSGYKNLEVVENGQYDHYLAFDCENIDTCSSETVPQPLPNSTETCDGYPNRQDYVGGSGVEFEKACFANFMSPALQDGGAIHVINAQVDLETCVFVNCSTDGRGGALFVVLTFLDCEIEIEECVFQRCKATEDGGAFYVSVSEDNNELEVDATQCIECTAGGDGGAFYVSFEGSNCNVEFEESSFESCVAEGDGGAIYFKSLKASRSTFEELTFTNNSARNGGAYYYSPFSYSKLCRCDFFNNTCTGKNCSSTVYLLIDPNQEKLRRRMSIKEDNNNETNSEIQQVSEIETNNDEETSTTNEYESVESKEEENIIEISTESENNSNDESISEYTSSIENGSNTEEEEDNETENINESETSTEDDEDDQDGVDEGDDEYDDAENNLIEDGNDNLTSQNVVLIDNIFHSDPLENTTQLVIVMKRNAQLLLGKNSFTFNGNDEEAKEINSKYISIEKDDSSNITFRFDGFICYAGNTTGIKAFEANLQVNCPIIKENPDKDGRYEGGEKEEKKKVKIGLIASIVVGCIAAVALVLFVVWVVIPISKRKDLSQYSTNLNDGGDSIVSNVAHSTNNADVPQL